jgi:uncharacterized membrane protein YcjF (UPF0283 family)
VGEIFSQYNKMIASILLIHIIIFGEYPPFAISIVRSRDMRFLISSNAAGSNETNFARLREDMLNKLLPARLGLAASEIPRPLRSIALPQPALGDFTVRLMRQRKGVD